MSDPTRPSDSDDEAPRTRWLGRMLRPLLAGSLALFPLATTVLFAVWLTDLLRGLLGPGSRVGSVLRDVGLTFATEESAAYAIGLGFSLLLIYLLGLLVESSLQSGWYSVTDRVMRRVPLLSTIYDAARRLAGVLGPRTDSDLRGMTPVICHLGGRGGTVVLGLLSTPSPIRIGEVDHHAVLIPSAPVPVGGLLVYVPTEWVEPAGFSVDGLVNVYVSLGVTSPESFARAHPATRSTSEASRRER